MVVVKGFDLEEVQAQTTGQVFPQKVDPIDDFGPEMGWEFKFAAEHPLAYPITRTLADIVPFASKFFPSGRKEFAEMSVLGKTLDIGLDLAVVIPASRIGQGFKAALGPVVRPGITAARKGAKYLPYRIRNVGDYAPAYLDEIAGRMDKFIYSPPRSRAAVKYGLADDEAAALMRGESSVWRQTGGRSSAFVEERPQALTRLFKKDGGLRKDVAENLKKWAVPPRVQRLNHQIKQYKQRLKPLIKEEADIGRVFNAQVERLFGPEHVGKMTLETINGREFSKVLMDLLINRGRIVRTDIGFPSFFKPTRKVFGRFEGLYKTFERIYKPVVEHFGNAHKAAMLSVEQWHKLLWQKNLVKLTKKGDWEKLYQKGKWKELYSKSEADEAGKALARIDNMQGAGVGQKEINAYLGTLSPTAQNLVKTFQIWTDFMYGDFMKSKIPHLFRRAGLTPRGEAAIGAEMERVGKGLNASISAIFSDSANLAYKVKSEYVEQILHDLRQLVKKNPRWFEAPEGDAVQLLLKQLTPRKPMAKVGFPNYLDNYTPRLFATSTRIEKAVKAAEIPEQMTAGFVKERTADIAEGRIEDLFEIIAARARQQGREIFVYPHLKALRETASTLPPRLRSYTGHYLSRMLGMNSKVDERIAGFLNASGWGGYWDARRVMNLSWKINDFIYMGGIGFKPFSATRNLMQPLLSVPADMGGIKDIYWMAKGARRAMDRETWKFLKEIGAITEYSPDILFRPTMSKLRKSLGPLKLPRKQELRDLSMWMFKKSDQWNRLWTGASAMEKWEAKFAKHMVGDRKSLKNFKKQLNLDSREKWVRKDIEDLLDSGSAQAFEEAKRLWIKDVIADTQYLYGAADSPLIGQIGGGVSKTAAVFQSWWMNYADLLGKWAVRSGSVSAATQRYFMWMVASAAIMTSMENVWGTPRARATAFLGPLPSQLDAPASWRPFIEALESMRLAAEITMGRPPEDAKKQMVATLKTASIFVPGGLMLKQGITGATKEGFPGFAKAIVGYRPPKK